MADGEENRKNQEERTESAKQERDAKKDILQITRELERGEKSYLQTVKLVAEANARIKQFNSEINRLQRESEQATGETKKQLDAQIKSLQDQKSEQENVINKFKEATKKAINIRTLGTEPLGRSIDTVADSIKTGIVNQLKQTPGFLLDTTKEVKNAELRMGKLSDQSKAFTQTLTSASMKATKLGSNIGEMAEMQADFTASMGRTVELAEEGHISMAELAHGTTLGKEGAVELTSQMQKFGISVQSTRDHMEDLINQSSTLGVSTEKTTENFKEGAKLAERFQFEEGMEDVKEMAKQASRFRTQISAVAPMAEKVFDVEGAVDMAANLQVMGGEMAKMADPFKLMHQARHDIKAFQESVIEATSDVASFNEKTGEIDIEGLQLHRLRKIAEQTGIEFEELANQARENFRMEKIGGQIPIGVDLDDKAEEFIKSTAQLDDKGRAKITINGEERLVKNLGKMDESANKLIMNRIERDKQLDKMAEQSKTFDQAFENLTNAFKSTLMPAMKAFSDGFREGVQGIHDWWENNGKEFSKTLRDWGEDAGNLVKGMLTFIKENPLKALIGGGAAMLIGKIAQWYARGMALGRGFLTQTRGMMGAAGGGYGGGTVGGYQQGASSKFGSRQMYKAFRKQGYGRIASARKTAGTSISGAFSKRNIGRTLKTGAGRAGIGMLGGLAGMGVDRLGSSLYESGAIGSGTKTGFDVASGALTGAGMGAMLGPWGALGGAAIGGLYGGLSSGGGQGTTRTSAQHDDFVMRPGEGAVPFNENDTIVGAKEGGPIEKSFSNTNDDSGGEMSMKFDSPLEVKGEITLKSEGGETLDNIDFDRHPELKRKIANTVQEELEKNINSGKLQPNP